MFVVNTSSKVIGFGETAVLPGSMVELMPPFTAEHPTVKFYLNKGFLTASNAGILTTGIPNATSTKKENLTARDVSRMNLPQLRETATNLNIEFVDADTRTILIDKITGVLFPAENLAVKDDDPPTPEGGTNEQE